MWGWIEGSIPSPATKFFIWVVSDGGSTYR